MRQMWILGIVAVFGLVAAAEAGSISQSYDFADGNIRMNVYVGQWDEEVNLNANLDTTWLLDSVSTSLYPNYYDPSEFDWDVYFSGRRDRQAVKQDMASSLVYQSGGVYFSQHVGVHSWVDDYFPGHPLYNSAYAGAMIEPARFRYSDSYYHSWENDRVNGFAGPTVIEKWWSVSATFHGSFGDGPAGDEIGRAFFGIDTPEPASLAILAAGAPLLMRRRQR